MENPIRQRKDELLQARFEALQLKQPPPAMDDQAETLSPDEAAALLAELKEMGELLG